jgi:hypothetical protein
MPKPQESVIDLYTQTISRQNEFWFLAYHPKLATSTILSYLFIGEMNTCYVE